MVIECPYCDARVDATVIATYDWPDEAVIESAYGSEPYADEEFTDVDPESGRPYRASLLVCTICRHVLLARQANESLAAEFKGAWFTPKRVYPADQSPHLADEIPEGIRESLEEAKRCLKAEAFPSTATACRRAIEGLCRHYHVVSKLRDALPELRRRGIIDGMLAEWAETLWLHGNIGAHPDPTPISEDDATDLFEFAVAICQYVFVLGEKFRKFKERTQPAAQRSTAVQ